MEGKFDSERLALYKEVVEGHDGIQMSRVELPREEFAALVGMAEKGLQLEELAPVARVLQENWVRVMKSRDEERSLWGSRRGVMEDPTDHLTAVPEGQWGPLVESVARVGLMLDHVEAENAKQSEMDAPSL
jgi:hypothetical protein